MSTLESKTPHKLIESSDGGKPSFDSTWVPFLASLIIHVALVILLAILAHGSGLGQAQAILSIGRIVEGEPLPEFEMESISESPVADELDGTFPSELSVSIEPSTTPPSVDLVQELPVSENPRTMSDMVSQADSVLSNAISSTDVFVSSSVESRKGGSRREAALQKGGNEASEKAVEDALQWIANHQNADGGWSLHMVAPCNGKCRNPSEHAGPQRAAATGLSLLCFLGAGYTHQDGPYQKVVKDGLYFLMQIMQKDNHGGHFYPNLSTFPMYEQGIATLALTEAYQMTKDDTLRPFCEDALYFLHYAQHTNGSWGYDPKSPGDLSIACWQMMAIKSASAAKLPVPVDSVKVFDRYLNSQQSENGAYYGYNSTKPKPSTTAMGLLMRMYRGWPKTDARLHRGAEYILKNGPSQSDVYLNYYATQVLFHLGGPMWKRWNEPMRDFLIKSQATQGHEKGSWYFDATPHNHIGGRLYTTAMSCMTLEVYYRFMPIYGPVKFENFEL